MNWTSDDACGGKHWGFGASCSVSSRLVMYDVWKVIEKPTKSEAECKDFVGMLVPGS